MSEEDQKTTVCAAAAASAPGKVILFGEHAVVYGRPAIASSLSDLRIYVKASTTRQDGQIHIRLSDLPMEWKCPSSCFVSNLPTTIHRQPKPPPNTTIHSSPPPSHDEILALQQLLERVSPSSSSLEDISKRKALIVLLYLIRVLLPPNLVMSGISIVVRSGDLPLGAGLGSSAAFSVAATAALYRLSRDYENDPQTTQQQLQLQQPNKEELQAINHVAFHCETILHGTPSGIDNAVSTHGGSIYYTKGSDGQISMEHIDTRSIHILITNTNISRSTKTMVARVRQMTKDFPEVTEGIFDAMAGISRSFRAQSTTISSTRLLKLVRMNQHLLSCLDVSHESLDTICSLTSSNSSCHATKLTGAGGGGCAITFIEDDDENNNNNGRNEKRMTLERMIMDTCHRVDPRWNVDCFSSTIGGDGVSWMDPSTFPEHSN